ncbi:mucoidy inhibitor MuiA family protein [Bradyrhizobium australafricanum]|uniref:mucoidy inhibitor MuiA family protein n=1 Tax=Bradyrhizobium australafricanum TaxID=2821406 RepID=UPI001CE34C11|nr:mucoidy inhibitor MuiA family protein [Bradyrhizobium australafricanum]MCA6105020.1 mucoidy inhibitor MuiA family protein [Bradyrhizobium australafricanum]
MCRIANYLVTTSLVLAGALVAGPLQAANLDAASQVDAVTVYPDGASVTRVITLDLPAGDNILIARDFPIGLDPSSLRVEGEGGAKLTIGAIDTKLPGPLLPQNLSEIEKRIEALDDQRADLQGLISAAEARRKFAERFAEASPAGLGEKGEARPLSEWRAAFSAVADEVATADSAIRDAERKIRAIDRDLAQLAADRTSKPPSKVEVRIDVASQAATQVTLRVTYAVPNARWTALYDARLDTGAKDRKPAIELVRRAEITQSTGEDWSNVALVVSTVRVARGGNAPDLRSLIVQYPQPPRPLAKLSGEASMRAREALAPAPAADAVQQFRFGGGRMDELEATAEVGAFQATFKIPGRVSVAANEGAKSLRISTATITPDLAVRAVPVIDPTAFLEASFVQADDSPLLPGQISIYRDGIFVGRSRMATAAKDETVRLGFGADDKVKIERTVVKRNEGSAGLIVTTSKTDERAFKTTVRNGHDFPIKVAVQDQLPVSENDDIVVEMLPSSTPATTTNLRDKRGVLEWAFEAKAGEVRDINFAWRMRWPKDKGVVMVPAG